MAVKKKATRDAAAKRPARKGAQSSPRRRASAGPVPHVAIPRDAKDATLRIGGKDLDLTNLDKVFWPEEGYTKRDLLQYYADVAHVILPHLRDRAITMKRYPHGITGEFFFMKRAPEHRPDWVETCSIMHKSKSLIAFPLAQDVPSLLWLINLGCIDLNQWYGTCDDPDRPWYLHFDLDPGDGAGLGKVLETARIVRAALEEYGMTPLVKTSGSSGVHVYVPIERGPLQKAVWTFAKALAKRLERKHPGLITAEYRIADRPYGRVLVDYNQNAWGRTLASVYSVRPKPRATVSTPVTWDELERGFRMDDFTIETVPARVRELGDLWQPLLAQRGRFPLAKLL
ncbi:MAG TPA: non-homologous end-joining DNA ligase [Gemmatimonadales bacterium]|nr:non-homologous end-joining DNA ligase [Gemmatimonadales bacterium]